MIIWDCPYEDCIAGALLEMPGVPLPTYAPHECEECHRTVWTKFSRLDPMSWTDAEFHEEFDVCEETKRITPRPSPNDARGRA